MNSRELQPLTAFLLIGPACLATLAITVVAASWLGPSLPSFARWPVALTVALSFLGAVLLAESPVWRLPSLAAFGLGMGSLIGSWFPETASLPSVASGTAPALALVGMAMAAWIGWSRSAISLRLRLPLLIGFWIYLIGLPFASARGLHPLLPLIAVIGWGLTFGLAAGWAAAIKLGSGKVDGKHRLACYVYALNLYLAELIVMASTSVS